jgi:hypothetical protein
MIEFTSPDGRLQLNLHSLASIESYLATPGNSLTGWIVSKAEGQEAFEPANDERKYWVHYRGLFDKDIVKLTSAMTNIEVKNPDELYDADWISLDKLWAGRDMYIGYTLVLVTPYKNKARLSHQKSIRPMLLMLPFYLLGTYIFVSLVGFSGKEAVKDYLSERYGKD